jgi:hypothetical protein
MIGWTSAFVELVGVTRPDLLAAFAPLRPVMGTAHESRALERIYRRLPARLGFSETVLAAGASRLGVLRVKGIGWSDWGHPRRVLASLGHAGLRPAWIDRVRLAEAG